MKSLAKTALLCATGLMTLASTAHATVAANGLFSDHTVLQRGKPCPVWGTATPSKEITVVFNGQTKTTTADAQGNWRLALDAMTAKAAGAAMTITEAGSNTLSVTDVVVGDVWICSGQSNMAHNLGGGHDGDVAAANYPGIRWMWVDNGGTFVAPDPLRSIKSTWKVCAPDNIGGFSAVAFYFARKIYLDQKGDIPIGLIGNSVGGTRIDPWLIQDGCVDIPVLAPLFKMEVMTGPFCLANTLIHPLAPFGLKGMIWYQGENSENNVQSEDSYYLKMKGLYQGYKRLFGLDDFAFYFVQIANWGDTAELQPKGPTPVLNQGGWAADTRLQQANAMALPHSGMASALDIGESNDWHPKDKLDVGERLALWALKNDYGRDIAETSGPILRDVTVTGNKAVCTFEHAGSGLMVGAKTPYQPTKEASGTKLALFSIAGADGVWYWADTKIAGNTIEMSSPSVAAPKKLAYANWTNPLGANLYNKVTVDGKPDGLPASPFFVDDVAAKFTITASAGSGGTISPVGKTTYLKRKTALYAITPGKGFYIQDVKVDGVSVESVKYYTFDPLTANHTIAATFGQSPPVYTITASVDGKGGAISPVGKAQVKQGESRTFRITPDGVNNAVVLVDGQPMGERHSFTFTDVRTDHTIAASFKQNFSLTATAATGGDITPPGVTVVASGSAPPTCSIRTQTGYKVKSVLVNGSEKGAATSYTFAPATANMTIAVAFESTPVYAVSGKVMAGGKPLAGAYVTLQTSIPQQFITKEDGMFSFTASVGNYEVDVLSCNPAYAGKSIPADVTRGQADLGEVKLPPEMVKNGGFENNQWNKKWPEETNLCDDWMLLEPCKVNRYHAHNDNPNGYPGRWGMPTGDGVAYQDVTLAPGTYRITFWVSGGERVAKSKAVVRLGKPLSVPPDKSKLDALSQNDGSLLDLTVGADPQFINDARTIKSPVWWKQHRQYFTVAAAGTYRLSLCTPTVVLPGENRDVAFDDVSIGAADNVAKGKPR